MVEVFKTDVGHPEAAALLVQQIQQVAPSYKVNFDLTDCDRILRVQSFSQPVNAHMIIELLKDYGFHAEVLPDVVVIK
jgi:hypothetical protein